MGYKSLTHDSVRRAAKERPPKQSKPAKLVDWRCSVCEHYHEVIDGQAGYCLDMECSCDPEEFERVESIAKKNSAAVALGRLGGKATGKRKARGDAQYYRDLQSKSAEKRKEKANDPRA